MFTDGSYTARGDHLVMYIIVNVLLYTWNQSDILYIKYISIKKKGGVQGEIPLRK